MMDVKGLALTVIASGALVDLGASYGVVERVQEVQIPPRRPSESPAVFEHVLRPRTEDQPIVRLDDGRAIAVPPNGMQVFAPGERVRLIHDRLGARLEHVHVEESVFFNRSPHQPSN
jgi:hypothetical protein